MKSPASLRSDRVATSPGLGGRFHRNTHELGDHLWTLFFEGKLQVVEALSDTFEVGAAHRYDQCRRTSSRASAVLFVMVRELRE